MLNTQEPLLLSRIETARRLGISYITLDRLVKNEHIRAVRIGRRVQFTPGEVARFAAEGCLSTQ